MDTKPIISGIVVTLIIGSISLLASFLGTFERIAFCTLSLLLGGLVAAYTTKGTSIDGGVHALIAGVISWYTLGAIIVAVFFLKITIIPDDLRPEGFMLLLFIFLVGPSFAIIGAIIGNLIKKYLRNRHLNGFLICNNCGAYYELKKEETSEDYITECDCGGQFIYKKSIPKSHKFDFNKKIFIVGSILLTAGLLLTSAFIHFNLYNYGFIGRISVIILVFGIWVIFYQFLIIGN